jgi:hypothetical protein
MENEDNKKNIFQEVDTELENIESLESELDELETTDELPVFSNEISANSLPDTPVGAKKYNRESMDGKEIMILKVQMFNANKETDELVTSLSNKDVQYYKTKFILTYDEENSEGVKHREYISGGIQFLQKNGNISAPSLWYEGANNQLADLFSKVAEFKKVDPKELSPREFLNFLNSGPKCLIKWVDVEFKKVVTHKNLVEKFL